MKRFILLFLFLTTLLFSKECSPYFNPEKFYDVPEFLVEIFDNHLQNTKIFVEAKHYKENFKQEDNNFFKENSYLDHGEYRYPIKNGVWKYTLKNNKIDEINIAQTEIYRFKDEEIANSLNDDFGGFWLDYMEDGYSMQLTPEQTLFRYNGEYFTFSVFVYGVVGDATPLKGTVVNYWLKNYTSQVNEHIQCTKGK